MPRANRYFCPGHVWHITQRCHRKAFLLRFARDRKRWRHWLFEARKRYGLCVLNYIVTSNHIHLLVKDIGRNEIQDSMQLISGRVAQEYNRRKGRRGAFWEDRYHATAVQSDEHLIRCLVYIDLNMVRAGVVGHPGEWRDSGYHEIQTPPARCRIVDQEAWLYLTDYRHWSAFKSAHIGWIEEELKNPRPKRESFWTESVAVGSLAYVEQVKSEMGASAKYRSTEHADGFWVLK